MLYRNPEHPRPRRRCWPARSARPRSLGRSRRRRRLAELDLLSMNGHLKRDLGLDRRRRSQPLAMKSPPAMAGGLGSVG